MTPGLLNSTSGPMAISEQTVRDSLLLAVEEINADGGIMEKQIEVIEEDGASDPAVFAEKIEKLLTEDEVEAVFGGWTSASRKAMLPVVEANEGLLFYPSSTRAWSPRRTSTTRARRRTSRSSRPWTS